MIVRDFGSRIDGSTYSNNDDNNHQELITLNIIEMEQYIQGKKSVGDMRGKSDEEEEEEEEDDDDIYVVEGNKKKKNVKIIYKISHGKAMGRSNFGCMLTLWKKGSHSKGSPISRHGMPELVPPPSKSIIPLPVVVGLHDSGRLEGSTHLNHNCGLDANPKIN